MYTHTVDAYTTIAEYRRIAEQIARQIAAERRVKNRKPREFRARVSCACTNITVKLLIDYG